jgi:hypothetical protein
MKSLLFWAWKKTPEMGFSRTDCHFSQLASINFTLLLIFIEIIRFTGKSGSGIFRNVVDILRDYFKNSNLSICVISRNLHVVISAGFANTGWFLGLKNRLIIVLLLKLK